MFPCEYYEFFKNNFSEEHLQTTASVFELLSQPTAAHITIVTTRGYQTLERVISHTKLK